MNAVQIKSYLADLNFPCDLNRLPPSAYLVGGSVRDALLQRHKTPFDLDFVLPEKAIATARQVAKLYNGGFVVLDEAREIARGGVSSRNFGSSQTRRGKSRDRFAETRLYD